MSNGRKIGKWRLLKDAVRREDPAEMLHADSLLIELNNLYARYAIIIEVGKPINEMRPNRLEKEERALRTLIQ